MRIRLTGLLSCPCARGVVARAVVARAVAALTLVAATGAARPLAAQDREASCRAALSEIDSRADTSGAVCLRLPRAVAASLTARLGRAPRVPIKASPRDLQSRASGNAAGGAGAAGTEAVATVQPTALAGGTLGALGTGGGADGIAAISLNPLAMLAGGGAAGAAKSRIADITLLAPLANDPAGDSLRYLGLRIRINTESAHQRRVLDSAESLFRNRVVANLASMRRLEAIFAEAPDAAACAGALAAAQPGDDVTSACGAPFDVGAYDVSGAAFRKYTATIRDSLDARYVGLDLRLDRGDPTFGAVPGLDGTFLYAGVAMGRRLIKRDADGLSIGWRGRVGAQYITVDSGAVTDSLRTGVATDVALAFEAIYPSAFRPIRIIGGVEYRSGSPLPSTTDDALELDGLRWRLSIDIPVTAANGVAIAYSTPLSGGGRPSLNVSFNWQLLLQELLP